MQFQPRSRPKINRDKKPQYAVPGDLKSQVSSDINRVAKPKSNNEPTRLRRALLHEQGGQRPRCAWRSLTTIDDDWSRRDRQRGRLKDAL